MKTQSPTLLGVIVRDYFTDHLPCLRGTSPHTIHSYRDSLVLLLRFLSTQRKKQVTGLDLTDLDPPGIVAFLSYLEQERKNGVPTRNVRLSAIHAFFHFVASRNPKDSRVGPTCPWHSLQARATAGHRLPGIRGD